MIDRIDKNDLTDYVRDDRFMFQSRYTHVAALLIVGLWLNDRVFSQDQNPVPPPPPLPLVPYPIPDTWESFKAIEKKEPPKRPESLKTPKVEESDSFPKLEIKSTPKGAPKIEIVPDKIIAPFDSPPPLEEVDRGDQPTNSPPEFEPGEITPIAGSPTRGELCCKSPWVKVPHLTGGSYPFLGFFTFPPQGLGFYSLWDQFHGNIRDRPPIEPYPSFALQPPSLFDADFRYLDHCDNTQRDFFDHVKRLRHSDDVMISLGGQHWLRYVREGNSRLSGLNNSYFLYRNRLSVDVWYNDRFRFFIEGIDARISQNDLAPLAIDRDWADVQNLFFEMKLTELRDTPVMLRVGRQELLFGSQRLVSTSDWANTRQTFQGVRIFRHSEKTDVDAFLVQPVLVNFNRANSPDKNIQFYGLWVQHRPNPSQFFDVYYLGLNNDNPDPDPRLVGRNGARGGYFIHTFGSRAAGSIGSLLYDVEGMLQLGQFINKDHRAYALTTAVGYDFQDMPWRTQLWIGNDLASGGGVGDNGNTHKTFNQLFPFGHYYFGFVDVIGRQNINDLNLQIAMYPQNWITFLAQYHYFTLLDRRDFLYNAAGRPTRFSPNGSAGRNVGQELDFLVNFHLSSHSDLQLGYAKLFAGEFLKQTGSGNNPSLFYFLYNFRW